MSSTFNILQHDSVRQQQQESNPSTPRLQPVPSLLSWSDVKLLSTTTATTTTTTITPTSPSSPSSQPSSSTSSPILSPEAQAFADDIYALHSKSSWQLSLSEPTLSLDEIEGRHHQVVVEKENSHRGQEVLVEVLDPPSSRPKKKERRRRTLHVDIPTKHIGHTRVVEDEEPISLVVLEGQGEDLEREEEVVVRGEEAVEERGRSRLRGEIRLGGGGGSSLPPPPPSSRQDRTVLLSPPHIICQAPTDSECPYGPIHDAVEAYGLPSSIIDPDRAAQSSVPCYIRTAYGLTDPIIIDGVTKQGGPLSPLKSTMTTSLGHRFLADLLKNDPGALFFQTQNAAKGKFHLPADLM